MLVKTHDKIEINVMTIDCEGDSMFKDELSEIVSSPIAVSQYPEIAVGEQ